MKIFASVILFSALLNAINCQATPQSCNTYSHPSFGQTGKCVHIDRCPGNQYMSNLCPSYPNEVKCCFTTPTSNCSTYSHPDGYGTGQCVKLTECQGSNQVSLRGYCDNSPSDYTCCFQKPAPVALKSCGLDAVKGKGVCVPLAQCPGGNVAAQNTCGSGLSCCYSLQKSLNYYEFRGVWISTVANIDWPSKKTLTTAQQQAELISILDTMQSLNFNAVVFQVRPAGDAFYASNIEPWSAYLTGTQGKAPNPFWDPLKFIITEAKARNLDVHAWLNPLRGRNKGETYAFASNHMSQLYPSVTYNYDGYIWMDPGSTIVRNHTLNVVEDIVRNYDIDAIHMDDYFYPYPVTGLDFPDTATYNSYLQSGGSMSKADWRRDNINKLVFDIYNRIKSIKPLVQFGISPFGIWRPGYPPGITGFDQYNGIYADAKLWLNNGWLDYMTPQLYWAIDPPAQSFPSLLRWWCGENTKNKLVFAGTALYKMEDNNWAATEIQRQTQITRDYRNITSFGATHFTANQIMRNVKSIRNVFSTLYSSPVLAPFMNV